MSGEEAGKLILNFQKQGAGAAEVQEMFNTGAKAARAYGLPVNQVLKDLGQSPEILARFGVANRKEFAVAAAKARSYGLSLKDINGAFGEQLDTFEGSSTAAAKLNSMFGTTINSFELMMQTDPTKRMEMLRKELLAQGKTWEKLSVFERNSITTTLGVDKATAQLMLSSEKERKKLEASAKEREKQIKIDDKWNEGMGSIKKTLIAWGPLLDKLMRSASNFIVKLFGGDSAGKTVMSTAKIAEKAIISITSEIDKATASMKDFGEGGGISFDSIVSGVKSSLELIKDFRDMLSDVKESAFSFTNRDLAVKTEASAQKIWNSMQTSGDIFSLGKNSMNEFREVEQNSDSKKFLEKKLLEKGLNKEQIAKAFADLYGKKALEIAPAQQDAYIHKDGKVVPISDQDNILVRKSMGGENNDAVVKAIERTYRTNFKNDVKG